MSWYPTGKYALSANGEEYDSYRYDSRDDAIESAYAMVEEYRQAVGDIDSNNIYAEWFQDRYEDEVKPEIEHFFVAEAYEFKPQVEPEYVIEHIQEDAYEYGMEWTDGYLDYSYKEGRERLDELGDMLTEAFLKWSKKWKQDPWFFVFMDSEEIKLESEVSNV